MDNKKTQRLYKLPFDPHAPGGYYDHDRFGLKEMAASWPPLPWYEKLWYHHLKRKVEPFYPTSIYYAIKRFCERCWYGYDYTDFWNLDYTFAKFILPRLKEFRRRADDKDIVSGYPIDCDPCYPGYCGDGEHPPHEPDLGHKKWLEILDTMIYSIENITLESEDYNPHFQTNVELEKKGFEYLGQYLRNLWE
jgi:hypothetical protein